MSPEDPSTDLSTQPSPENSAPKVPVSERRIEANRRNARRSTGPKTARGKRTVARNAIKHGFLAREVVITAGDGEESLKDFHRFLGRLWECYEPFGVIEEMLVERIAICWWRLARATRAENGEIRKRLDTIGVDRALRDSAKVNLALLSSVLDLRLYSAKNPADGKTSTRDRYSALQRVQSNLWGHYSGLAYLRVGLEKAKSEIASDGYMSEETRNKIFGAFCFWDCLFALACRNAGPPETKMEDRPSEKAVEKQTDTDEERVDIVALINYQLERISVFEEYALEHENIAVDAEARSFSLPPADATDKLLRYEAHLDRQLYRAMDQLERLQRQRRGENVPPPLNINLGKRT